MTEGAIFGILITLLFMILGIFFRKSKILLLFQVVWILVLMIYNTNSIDFKGNSALYYESNATSIFNGDFFGSGFYFVSTIAKKVGMDYLTFNGILATISTLLILYVILKYCSNPCLVVSFFMWYPMIDSIIQKRWYFAMGILVYGVSIIFTNKTKTYKTIFLFIFTTFACLFHAAAIYFYVLIIYYWIPDKYKRQVSIIGFVLLTLGKSILANVLSASSNADLAGKSSFYFGTLASNVVWHYIFWIVWQLLFVCLIFFLIKKKKIIEFTNKNYSYNLWVINWWSILILPLYNYDPVFTRLFRIVIIFEYIAVANLFIIKNKKINKINFYSNIYQLILCISTFIIIDTLAGCSIDQLVYPIFENNIILNLFS